MAKLLLAKHSSPVIAPEAPSHRWVLSERGQSRARWLAQQWRQRGVSKVYASLEPKALETAAVVAAALDIGLHPRPGLEENDRTGLGFLSADDLTQTIARFFAAPNQLIIGAETAANARARFEAAVRAIAAQAGNETVGIVAHGTVITLLVAAHNGLDPMEFWGQLDTPSYLVIDAADFTWDGDIHKPPVS